MNVRLIEEPGRTEIEMTLRSAPGDPRALRSAERVRGMFGRLVGYPDGSTMDRRVIAVIMLTLAIAIGALTSDLDAGMRLCISYIAAGLVGASYSSCGSIITLP
ncbi:MAG: hypothetical protein QM302_04385 [Acidobacteriota bacterium]|nr:hypothetical protein [Acidobacteriota bacterium]